jgi:hypothetical protein
LWSTELFKWAILGKDKVCKKEVVLKYDLAQDVIDHPYGGGSEQTDG